MAIAYWMILAAALLPYLAIGAAKGASRDYDNHAPRQWLERQQGWRRRAGAAERNHFEAFPAFAAAVLLAGQTHAPAAPVSVLAVLFVLLRLGYTACYLADVAFLRSLFWTGGLLCVLAIFCVGVLAA
jgi:uncharacterized MAPEG superfamily protein